jgi:hypothetical protein
MYGKAGAWADEKGVARLGAWRPGKYTLVVRIIGFDPETRAVTLSAGRSDTVRIELRPSNMTLQSPMSIYQDCNAAGYCTDIQLRKAQAEANSRIRTTAVNSRPLGERLAIQFNDEPPIIQVSDGSGGPPITYHGQPLTDDRIKAIYVLKAKEARERFGDQTLAGAILFKLK